MADFGINFNSTDIKPKGPEKKDNQEDNSPVLFTKSVFMQNISSTLKKSGASQAQISQYSNQAGSIFDTYDNSPKDSKWTQAESQNGGASALASFYEQVNNAIKAASTQQTKDVNSTETVENKQSVPTEAEVNQAKTEFVNKFLNASPAEQKQIIQQEINDLKAAGYEVSSVSDNGDITIKNPDGTTGIINIYEAMGVPKPVESDSVVDNAAKSLDALMAQGFQPVGNPVKNDKGELIGTLKNPQTGEEIKFNLNTNKIVEE